jgi:glyoxylase-like metal-dependent hydrolase (beta-lactamase superfamily II)
MALLTGDTIFLDGVGRPDLAERAEEFAENLYDSIHTHTDALGDDVAILPAHVGTGVEVQPGQMTTETLGTLRWRLAPLTWPKEQFIAWAASEAKDRPPNYQQIVIANQGDRPEPLLDLAELEVGPNRCAVVAQPG